MKQDVWACNWLIRRESIAIGLPRIDKTLQAAVRHDWPYPTLIPPRQPIDSVKALLEAESTINGLDYYRLISDVRSITRIQEAARYYHQTQLPSDLGRLSGHSEQDWKKAAL